MTKQPKLHATPVARVISRTSGQIIGYLYTWNNGEKSVLWIRRAERRVAYEAMDQGGERTKLH